MNNLSPTLLHTAWTEEEKEQIDETIEFVESYNGKNFLLDACLHLYRYLRVDYIVLGLVENQTEPTVRTNVFLLRGLQVENISFPLVGSPGESVIHNKDHYYPSGVQNLYPQDKLLAQMAAESFIGIPLFGHKDKKVGILSLLHNTIIQHGGFVEALINVLLPRIEDELSYNNAISLNKFLPVPALKTFAN